MKLGFDLTIEQTQKLVMTPELIQAIKILQFNTQELSSYVQEQLLTNPVLETSSQSASGMSESGSSDDSYSDMGGRTDSRTKDTDSSESSGNHEGLSEFDWREQIKESRSYDDISYRQWEYDKNDKKTSFEQYTSSESTLVDHLLFQLQFAPLSEAQQKMGAFIIESLDDNGYMTLTPEEIAKRFNTSEDKVSEVLEEIQGFEPYGVAAQNLRECLRIQLLHMDIDSKIANLAEDIIVSHLEDIASNRLSQIAKALNTSVQRVQEAGDLIKRLEPKPGRQFASQTATRYIVPDVLVEKIDGEYVITINDNSTPHLMISSYYERLLSNAESDPDLAKYLSSRINSAMWLIKSIEQRKQTITSVVTAVVNYQREFFEKGPKYLRTMTLKQIAEEVGIHESTVSRSVNGKYMQSPRGLFEIKYFFTSGVAAAGGEGVSSKSIKTLIKEMVETEDEKHPLSDQEMANILKEKDIDISRRTIAKYRDELGILSSSKRKRF